MPSVGRMLALLLAAGLAACQTAPAPGGFTARQVQVLRDNGFVAEDDHWQLGLADRLLFGTDESRLAPAQQARLKRLADVLVGVGIGGAEVEGNTDSTGTREYNRMLSQRRAVAVRAALIEGGMPEAAVRAIGRGEDDAVESNRTASGRRENRRVVIIVRPGDTGGQPGALRR